jgi:hypothetical protein
MMIGLRAQAGLLFVEADSEFTFSGGPKQESTIDAPRKAIVEAVNGQIKGEH